jgi:glyoxylase-like metal-dependent hydrolase (beta-lactamase superfamily II)
MDGAHDHEASTIDRRRQADLPADLRPVPRGLDLVRADELADGLWCLRLPLPYLPSPSVNAYLLALDDGYCLVDCGTSLEPGWEALEHALELAGARPADIRRLVCTHLHADHAGLAATLVERTGCALLRAPGPHTVDDRLRDPVIALAQRREEACREGVPEEEVDRWVDTHLADDVHHERARADRLLAAGDVLDTRAGRWRVVPTPGHSPTQIALVEERGRWAITADLAYDIAAPFLEYGWTLDPYGEHLASIARVAALEPRALLPGHGRPVDDAAERLEAARQAAEALAVDALAALDRPRTAYELVTRAVPDAEENNLRQSMLSISLCVLEHLEARGWVAAQRADDGVRRFTRVPAHDP